MLVAAVFFAGGIAVEQLYSQNWLFLYFALLIALFSLACRQRFLAGLLLLLSAGWGWTQIEDTTYERVQESLPREKIVELSGRVASLPTWEPDRVVLNVQIQEVREDKTTRPVSATVELQIYSSVLQPKEFFCVLPMPGDPVRFLGELRFPDSFRNPGRLPLDRRLREQRVHRVVVLKSSWLLDFRPQNHFWNRWFLAIRDRNRLGDYWPERHKVPSFLNALVWGDRSLLPPAFINSSQSVGVYHLLVVSGMHFALILGAISLVGRHLHLPFAVRAALLGSAGALLLVRTPFGPSVYRAALVACGVMALEWLWRKGSNLNLLGGAALVLLCYQPLLLFNAGFQFSFVSCLVLAQVVPPLKEALIYPQVAGLQSCWRESLDLRRKPASRDARRIRFRLECLMETRRWLQPIYFLFQPVLKILSLLSRWMLIAFLIQNETFLLSTFHSNQGPGPALLANVVMVPLTSVLLFPGFLLSLLPLRLYWAAWVTEKLVNLCYGSVGFFDRWTLPDHPQAGPILLGLVALVFVVQATARDATVQKVLVLAILALNLGWLWCPLLGREIRPGAYFFDVGQGDCAALVDRRGHAIVIDAGTFASNRDDGEEPPIENMFLARNVISRALWHIGVRQINAIFVSHLHADHISAVGRLARNFRAGEVYLSPSAGSEGVFSSFVRTIPLRTQIHFVNAGDPISFNDFWIDVLHPPWQAAGSYGNINENSMVLRVHAGAHKLLFTGDMSSRQESALCGRVGHIDILKVAHHGSASSTSQQWLDELRPDIAVISVGKRNPFEHPHPVTIQRLGNAGIKIHRTDREGCIYVPLEKFHCCPN